MPEGPELALSRDFLRYQIRGQVIKTAACYPSGRYRSLPPDGYRRFLQWLPWTIVEIYVKGKFMYWKLSSEEVGSGYLFCTYGMTGQWRSQPSKHTAFSFHFQNDSAIYFNDQRHFGTLKFEVAADAELNLQAKLKSLGPDMLNDPPSLSEFKSRLSKHPTKTLPEVLMNQRIISGVGNYIKAEALYRAGLSPKRMVGTLSSEDFSRLYQEIREVMKESYQLGGATIRSYANPDGSEGSFTKSFRVYKKDKDPQGFPVIGSSTLDKRVTWWCPEVQR